VAVARVRRLERERALVRRRVDVDEKLPKVAIPGRILNELFTHAREAEPEECCGLIVAVQSQRFDRVVRCQNKMTQLHANDPDVYPRDGKQAFYMSPSDYRNFLDPPAPDGERVTAVYHSHVGADAYLSEMDLDFAEGEAFPFPDADQIVVGVLDGQVGQYGIFRKDPETKRFVGMPIVTEVP
jgi:proteasome lid subunit RPN8/RPN11